MKPALEGSLFFEAQNTSSMELWQRKLQQSLSSVADLQSLREFAELPAPDTTFQLWIVGAYISSGISEATKSKELDQVARFNRHADALKRAKNHLDLLHTALKADTRHGPAMARRLLSWTLGDLMDALTDPPMPADLTVLGLREGLSAAELIGLHRAGLTRLQVNQVRRACQQTGRAEPSLRDIALYGPERGLESEFLAWGMNHGFMTAELPALRSAGWGADSATAPPVPDDVSRQLDGLCPTQRSSREGWTELEHPHGTNAPACYWFKPCTRGSQDEQQLRQGLFVQALAQQLGLSQRILPVRAHVREHQGQQVYGVLMGPVPALRKSGRPPRSADPDRTRQQQNEVSWLTWLSGMEWREKDHHWTDSREDAQLCLGLPLATSDADTADDTPLRFIDMDQPQLVPGVLKRTLQALPLDATPPALAPALAGLSPSERVAFERRWRVLDLDKTTELPPPRARKITRLVTAQSERTPSRTLRRPRTWLQRLAPLQVAEDSPLMAAANRFDTVEGLDADLASKPPTSLATRLVTWGQLQRARAHLIRHLTAWDPTTVPSADRAEAQGARQRLLDRLQGMPTSVRHLSARVLEQVRKAGVDDDKLLALTGTLKTYAHRVHQPLPAGPTALSELQTLEDGARRLVSSLDKQVAELQQDLDQPVPKDLEKVRVALKTDLRRLSDAMTIAQEMLAAPADRPAMSATPAELMALAAQPDITPAMRQAAWQAGATPADLMRVHQAPPPGGLPPTWALLADSVLQDRAVALVKELTGQPHASAQAVAAMRQRLQAIYPLSEVALLARLAMDTAGAPPDLPSTLNTPPSPQGHLPLGGSQVMRALSWNVELSVSDDSPQAQALGTAITAYDQAVRSLESLSLDSPGLATAASQAEQRLLDLHKALLLATAVGGLQSLGGVLLNEAAVLKKLPTVAARLVAARPPSGPASPANTATRLLTLLAPGGPDERQLLHGWLAGWQLADIGQAHQEGLPAWVMDLDGSASVARARQLRSDVPQRMTQLHGQMQLPGGG